MRNAGSGVKGVSRIQCQRSATFDDRVRNEDCENGPACACTGDTVHKFGLPRQSARSAVRAEKKIDLKDRERAFLNDGREIG
jgi:hypothetical protein